MAQRKVQKVQGQKLAAPRGSAPVKARLRPDPVSPDGWRQECERLRAELQVARDEIATLRSREEQVLNRIDGVLDALDGLRDAES